MKAYKGFNKNLKCMDMQYEIGKEYVTDKARLCIEGYHACEDPLNVLEYYPPCDDNANYNRFCEVEVDDVSSERSGDTKIAAKKIKIGAEINLFGLAKAHVEYVNAHIDNSAPKATNTGNQSAATNTGNQSAATNTGYQSAAMVDGIGSVAIVTGYQCKAKANIGSAIVVCERGEWDGKTHPLLGIRAAIVDGVTIKADTFYTLKDGEFVETE